MIHRPMATLFIGKHVNRAIVVGSINMDIVVFVKNHPKVGETIFGREVKYFPGGKGFNQAVACKRLGSKTMMIGRLGDDTYGEQLLAFQQREGIDISGIRQLKNIGTGTAFITVSENSDNSIIVISGANALWDDDFFDDVVVEAGDIVLAQFEIPDQVIEKAFKKAKDCGATTILNPSPARAIARNIKDLTDLLVLNEHELAELSGTAINLESDDAIFAAAERLGKHGYRTVIVTLGDKGVRLLHNGKKHTLAARTVNAIDTTGAGDTFIGGLASGLLSGLNVMQSAERGNVAASISVTRPGAAASIPTLTEVNQILNAQQEFV